ncbi:hypothetical protein ACQP2T_26545 [Nonomuraea sp. CA-143628]|uniref:hypothetical protein n=1 Tax=Nonomuraea sp. CA-143628 TaxID=3239997 RepID=UPI003D8F2B5C
MARLGDVLARFRPFGVPGAAAALGVPVDYAADQAEELAPVFSALADVQADCMNERWRAQRLADQAQEGARVRAAAIVSAARAEAEAERVRSSAAARQRDDQASAALLREAALAADGVRRRSARTAHRVGKACQPAEPATQEAVMTGPRPET